MAESRLTCGDYWSAKLNSFPFQCRLVGVERRTHIPRVKTYALETPPPPLAALVEEVKQGEEIVLTDHAQPVARIVSLVTTVTGNGEHHAPLKAGCLKGFWMAPDFDEPLEEFKEYME